MKMLGKKTVCSNDNQVTLLLTTCDKYADSWLPFFHCWNTYYHGFNYPIVINSETKGFETSNPNITSFLGGNNIPWSKRLKECLKTIKTEYVLLCLEDYFLQSSVDEKIFNSALKTMEEDKSVGVIQFAIDISCRYDKTIVINDYFSPVPIIKTNNKTHNGRIYCVLSLYRTKYLNKLLVPSESPWEFEIYGTLRSQYYREKVYREREDHKRCFEYLIEPKYGYGISRGKWLPKNRELFFENNISVDFSNLGIMTIDEWQKWVEQYEGKRIVKKKERIHRTTKQKLGLLFKNPKEFLMILVIVLKKRKTDIKFKFPFLR